MTTAPAPAPADSRAAPPSPPGDAVIDLADVYKTYRGRVHALRGVSMHVRRGEIFGLLGPNGAGKSTLVKILMTVIRPSRCRGHMLGAPIGHKPTLARVGYLPEHHRFPDYLTARQVVDFFGAMADVPGELRRARTDELLDLVGLTAWSDKRVKSFSKGMRQRLGLAQALINDPDLVLLDEPTDGVDPVGRRDIRNILAELRRRGKTVFLNSHLLSELEMVCDRVAIMVQGLVTSQGTIAELTEYGVRYEIETSPPDGSLVRFLPSLIPGAAANGLAPQPADPVAATLPTGEPVEVHGDTLRIRTTDPAAVQPLIDNLRRCAITIRAVRLIRPTLEDLFMRAVTDPTTGEVLAPGAAQKPGRRAGHGGAA